MPSIDIKDQVALVTGTNKKNGIGRAIVLALLKKGAKKVYATARNTADLKDLVAEQNGKVVAVQLDLMDVEAIKKLPALYPDTTIIVNNAGYLSYVSSSLTDEFDKMHSEMQVNYLAVLELVSGFAPALKRAEKSAVVNIASIGALINFPLAPTYSASKAAAHSLTQAQRRDLPDTIVVGVYPGPIDTAMIEDMPLDNATPPSAVADAIMTALEEGQEDVFPDPVSQQMYEGWKADAKAMEKQMVAQAQASSSSE